MWYNTPGGDNMTVRPDDLVHHPFRETCACCWAVQEVSFDHPVWLIGEDIGPAFCSQDCLDEWAADAEERRVASDDDNLSNEARNELTARRRADWEQAWTSAQSVV